MSNIGPQKLAPWLRRNRGKELVLVLAAGFETRAKALMERLKDKPGLRFSAALVLDYADKALNEPTRSDVLRMIGHHFESFEVIATSEVDSIPDFMRRHKTEYTLPLIDISGMSRVLIFMVLHRISMTDVPFNIAYTEAEGYFPDKTFYNRVRNARLRNKDTLFDILDEIVEKKEIVYSYNCEITQPPEFWGMPEPGRPPVLIGFLAFKRSRIQSILSSYEFSVRIFILSRPVRQDLRWREELMEIINMDILKRRPSTVLNLATLNPFQTYGLLDKQIIENPDCQKSNIYLAPLGSKMQTVGSFLLWKKYPDISVIFSQPNEYFKESFSEGWRDTFVVPFECLSSVS